MRRSTPANRAVVLAGALFAVAVLVGVMFFAGFWRLGSSYDVSAYVANARGIAVDSTVFEAGLPVGIVSGVRRNGPDAILSLRITGGPRPLPVDSKIVLGLRSLAGEADVELFPGHSRQLVRNGGSLGLRQDESYTEVDQILNTLSGANEQNARELIQGIGGGVAGEGDQLNRTLGNAASLIDNSAPLTATLAAQHGQVAAIVANFGSIMSAIGQRSDAVSEFATGARTTFDAVAARDVALGSLLRQLPGALTHIRRASTTIGAVSPTITPVLADLGRTLTRLNPALHLLSPAAHQGTAVIDDLGGASPALRSVLTNLVKLGPSAKRALPQVHATLCQLDPIIRYISPYGPDLAAFFEDFGATDDFYDDVNHEFPASVLVNPNTILRGVNINGAGSVAPALDALLNTGVFGRIAPDDGFDPQPLPGGDHNTTRGLNDTGATQFGADHRYPHVTEDCSR